MAFHRASKAKPKSARSRILLLVAAVTAIALLFLFSSMHSTTASKPNLLHRRQQQQQQQHFEKYLYWGTRIDCPGKHCGSCEGLGHQESSLRCALEEAVFLGRGDSGEDSGKWRRPLVRCGICNHLHIHSDAKVRGCKGCIK